MQTETPAQQVGSVMPLAFGFVSDTAGSVLSNVSIYLGNGSAVSNSSGHYFFTPTVSIGTQPIIAIKTDYNNYYFLLNFTASTSVVNHNITLEPANLNNYPTGPYADQNEDDQAGDETEKAKEIAEELGQDFWVSTSEINKQVRENTFIEETISVYNFRSSDMQILFSISSELEEIMKLDKSSMTINPDSFGSLVLTISGTKPIGVYTGKLTLSGDLEVELPVKIEIVPKKFNIERLLMEIELELGI